MGLNGCHANSKEYFKTKGGNNEKQVWRLYADDADQQIVKGKRASERAYKIEAVDAATDDLHGSLEIESLME